MRARWRKLARMLVAAENPVLVADRAARTPAGMAHLVELAEALQAPVIDQGGRMNFPTRHPLNQTERATRDGRQRRRDSGPGADGFWGTINAFRDQLERTSRPITKPGAKLVSISAGDLYMKRNYQDIQRYTELDLAIAADAEATLPSLIEAVKRLMTDDRKRVFAERGEKLADAHQQAWIARATTRPTVGMRARSARRAFPWSCGRRSRTKTGRCSRTRIS